MKTFLFGQEGWRVGSAVRALDWRSKSRGFESRQEHTNNYDFFPSRNGCADPLSVCSPCVYARIRKTMHTRYRSCSPCQSSVDCGNTKITSMHLYPGRRRNVAALVAEELKTVTYAAPPMEERIIILFFGQDKTVCTFSRYYTAFNKATNEQAAIP